MSTKFSHGQHFKRPQKCSNKILSGFAGVLNIILMLFLWFTRFFFLGGGEQMVETFFKNDSFFMLNLFMKFINNANNIFSAT